MVARIALTFSLLASLAVSAFSGPYADLDRQLKYAKDLPAKRRILDKSPLIQNDQTLSDLLAGSTNNEDDDTNTDSVSRVVELRSMAEDRPTHTNLQSMATDIKRSPVYTDPGERESTNWLGRALERLRNFRFRQPKTNASDLPSGLIGPWIIYVAWILLGGAVLLFLYFGLRNVDFATLRRRRASRSVLEEEEPERTIDEWLALADQLERDGKFREAVRCLYVACLHKLDEARVARFDRGQTNWEHLARIEASPRRPVGLDFRTPTQAFDRIWYGYMVNGPSDVADFRRYYREIVDSTRQVAA